MPFAENLGTGGGALDAQYGSSPGANTNAPLLLDPRTSGPFVYTPGSAGNYVSVPHSDSLNILGTQGTPFLSLPGVITQYAESPDHSSLDITGDIEVVARFSNPDTALGVVPFAKWTSSGNQRSYALFIDSSRNIGIAWTTDGATVQTIRSNATLSYSANQIIWMKATLDVNDGSGNHVGRFFWAVDQAGEPSVWTQLGTDVTVAGTTSIYSGTSSLFIGSAAGGITGTTSFGGRIYSAIVRNGIGGTTVFDADFTQQALGSRGFIESTGKLVSLVGNAAQIVDGTTYGFSPGVSGAYWSAPDSAALSITGDIDIRARISLNDWTPSAEQVLVGKWLATGNQRSYALRLTTGGTFYLTTSNDGTAVVTTSANAANTLINGQTYWVRATLDVNDGAGNRVANFYYAADSETEPTVWTSIGTTVTVAGATSIFDSTALLEIGSFNGGTEPVAGRVYRAIIRANLTSGTKAFDADFTRQLQFASSFTEGSSNLATVTTQGAARIERERNLEIVTRVALDAWTGAGVQTVVAKDDSTIRSYRLSVNNTGNLVLDWYPTGTSTSPATASSSAAVTATAGQTLWLKATLDVFAATTNVVTFYTAPDSATEPVVWTPLGTAVTTTGATSIAPTTAPVAIGARSLGLTEPLAGKVWRTIIRNGIGGSPVLDIDFADTIATGSETYLPDTVDEVIPEAVQFLPNLGWGGAALNARFGSAVGADTNDPLLLTHTGTSYLYLSGIAGNYASTPDAAALDITNDIDLVAYLAADDWTPSAISTILAKEQTTTTRSYRLSLLTTGALRLMLSANGSTETTATSSLPVPAADGAAQWVRATWRQSDGRVQFFVGGSGASPSWVQLGIDATIAIASINPSTSVLEIGSRILGTTELMTGKVYRAQVLSGIGGTVVFDADFTTGITSGSQTTFTESSSNAATVTINRSTSGRKSVAVVQDVLLFGTDDYLEVPDNDLLDFGASDSFTVMTAVRQWATVPAATTFVAKKTNLTTAAGWSLYGTNAPALGFLIADGTADPSRTVTPSLGSLSLLTGVRDVAADTIVAYLGTTPTATTPDTTTATLANAETLRVGRLSGVGTSYGDMEFHGSAVWRRALTAAEVALVNNHYTTGPTAASTALMQQAVWWVDAGTRSVAQINRSTSGRKTVACARCIWLLGTDDYFEVPASTLFDFAQGQDYTLLVLHRGWWAQGTSDTLLATSSSTTASAAGWAMSNSSGDPWQASGRHGDGSLGVTALAPRRDVGALSATWLVRDCDNDTLTAFTGSTSGTPVTDTTTGTIANTNVMRLGRLSSTGTEYLDAEVVAAVVWRRRLTAAERNAVLAYYGV